MTAYYNEFDAYPAQWLRNLERAGHIAAGRVDERSILEVKPEDLNGTTQAHFFAGIGVWSYALRQAGWPDDREVWTGSCPCQPFSVAGRKGGVTDERHLWPEWFRLIRECRPAVILGEQVASPDGLGWLDAVCIDLEGAGYAVGAVDTCAAGFGAPHIRQRLYFCAVRLADDGSERRGQVSPNAQRSREGGSAQGLVERPVHCSTGDQSGGLADTSNQRLDGWRAGQAGDGRNDARLQPERFRDARRLADSDDARLEGRGRGEGSRDERTAGARGLADFRDVEWLPCRDGKFRPTQPGLFPLAHGATSRVGRLRAYGNGLQAHQATGFVKAVMGVIDGSSSM